MNSRIRPLWAEIALGIVVAALILLGVFMAVVILVVFLPTFAGEESMGLPGVASVVFLLVGVGLLCHGAYRAYER
jgi:hypothetical protein